MKEVHKAESDYRKFLCWYNELPQSSSEF